MDYSKKIFSFIVIFFMLCAPAYAWQQLSTGLEYQRIQLNSLNNIHLFRIDPNLYNFRLVNPDTYVPVIYSLQNIAANHQAVVLINGGFFHAGYNPLGLRVSDGRLVHPVKKISWWPVFYITKNGNALIVPNKQFALSPDIQFAIQAGPRLVSNNNLISVKPGVEERTALGIDARGRILILVTDKTPLSLRDLAVMIKKYGAVNAMNLDGGSSTQLYADVDDFQVSVSNLFPVADLIAVVPK